MEIANGKIIDITPNELIIKVPYTNIERACLRKYLDVLVGLPDGRMITPLQRKKAYVLIKAISDWAGYTPVEVIKELTKLKFSLENEDFDGKLFSLSNCDVTTAKEYISFLINFAVENSISTGEPLYTLCEDINKYVYACLINKVCAVCGQPAQLHHVNRVGAGRDRTKISHIGLLALPLCFKHHTECHSMPQEKFNQKYHLAPIKIDEPIRKKYNLNKGESNV